MSTLKQLVDETTNIKNELKTCHTNLKNNLIEKGVECSDTDKLLSLANKVGEIELGKKFIKGITYQNTDNSRFFNTVCESGHTKSSRFHYVILPKPDFEVGLIVLRSNPSTVYNLITSTYCEGRIVTVKSQKELENGYYDNHNTYTVLADINNSRQQVFFGDRIEFPYVGNGEENGKLNYYIYEK